VHQTYSNQGPLADFCEKGNENLGSVKCRLCLFKEYRIIFNSDAVRNFGARDSLVVYGD